MGRVKVSNGSGDKGSPKAKSTLIGFHFKTHNFCYVYVLCPHYYSVFEPLKQRLFKTLLTPFSFENPGIAFWSGWGETETVENGDADTHVHFLIGSYQSRCVLP